MQTALERRLKKYQNASSQKKNSLLFRILNNQHFILINLFCIFFFINSLFYMFRHCFRNTSLGTYFLLTANFSLVSWRYILVKSHAQFSKHVFFPPLPKQNKISMFRSINNWNYHCLSTFPSPTHLRIQSWKYLHRLLPHANHFKQRNCLNHFSILQSAHSSATGRISPYIFTLFLDFPFLSLKAVKHRK